MSLHVETQGSGAPLLLIHGWGMHGGMWDGVAKQLAQNFEVHSVDLPGHGHSKYISSTGEMRGNENLDEIVKQLASQFAQPLSVCGWSLGGQVALRWAQLHPEQIQKLLMVATTPCFVQQDDWDCAMAAETLQDFAASLLQNHTQSLRRFLALQVRGSEQERELLTGLRAQLFSHGEPDTAALKSGLAILRNCDLRKTLGQVSQPVLLLSGDRDTLTPLAAMQYMQKAMPNARLETIKGAAHAPFLSHPQLFVQSVMSFLNE